MRKSQAEITVLANGCGGSSSSNGEAAKSAAAVFTDARHAALGATSVHVAGALTLLCAVDEPADVLRRLAGGTFLGCFGAHAFVLPR